MWCDEQWCGGMEHSTGVTGAQWESSEHPWSLGWNKNYITDPPSPTHFSEALISSATCHHRPTISLTLY